MRVLDFTQVLAGPTATRLLVELGAEVIKVEARGGELGRVLPRVEKGRSGYFVQQNRGKRSVCVDLKNDRGRELILDLVPECDVMIQNFAHGVMERLGFGYEALRERNPRIVACNMSAFGDEGPLASRPGYDGIAGSWAGVFHMLGYPDQAPILPGVSPGDVLTGVHAFGGVAAALSAVSQGAGSTVQGAGSSDGGRCGGPPRSHRLSPGLAEDGGAPRGTRL